MTDDNSGDDEDRGSDRTGPNDDDVGWTDADSVTGGTDESDSSSGLGMDPELTSALCYLLVPWMGLVVLLADERDEFARFHAVQSIVFGVVQIVAWIVLFGVTFLLSFLTFGIAGLVLVPLMLLLAFGAMGYGLYVGYRAYQGDRYEIPYLAKYAEENL